MILAAQLGLWAGCEPSTLSDLGSPVGETCPETTYGDVVGISCPDDVPSVQYEFRREARANLHVVLCNATTTTDGIDLAGAFHVDVPRAVLGRHELAGTGAVYYRPESDRPFTAFMRPTGFVDIRGYDPVRGRVCGSVDMTLESEDERLVQRGSFVAVLGPTRPMRDAGADGGIADAPGDCQCDDAIDCTEDACDDGVCRHRAVHTDCGEGEYCSAVEGCVAGGVCATEVDCVSPDPCVGVRCDASLRRCVYSVLDGDVDGHAPLVCGGGDCDDANPEIHPGAIESCDGVDSDCSGGGEPSDALGCRTDEVCSGAECGCRSTETLCDLRVEFGTIDCRDLQSDAFTCGSCTNHCVFGQECVEGACQCSLGFTDCVATHGVCADVSSDAAHCGGCGRACSLRCVSGECLCPEPLTTCDDGFGARCADLGSEIRNCGACGNSCLGLTCVAGRCPIDVGDVFRAYGRVATPVESTPLLARDAISGNLLVAFVGESISAPRGRLPDATVPLWTTGRFVGQFDPSGDWVRTLETSEAPARIVGGGGRHLLLFDSRASSVVVAGVMEARPGSDTSWTAAFMVDASTGVVLSSRALPGGTMGVLLSDGSAALLVFTPAAADFGNAVTLTGDSTRPVALLWLNPLGLARTARRLPGHTVDIQLDPRGGIWIGTSAEGPATFTFGGDNFTLPARYVAHYAADGTHVRSFPLVRYTPLESTLASADTLFELVDLGAVVEVRRHVFVGDGADSTGSPGTIRLGSASWGSPVRLGTSNRIAAVSINRITVFDVETARMVVEPGMFGTAAGISYVEGDGTVFLAGALGRTRAYFGEHVLEPGYEGFFLTEIVFAP